MQVHRSCRSAFTLIELLTVIAIIAVLAALTAIFFPNFQDTELVNRGADQLQNWLLSAKMQAKRDGLPTGLFLKPGGPATLPFTVPTAAYIQQPNPFAMGIYTGADTDPNPSLAFGTFGFPRAKFFIPPASPAPQITFFDGTAGAIVSPGDYLEVYGGGVLHRIRRVPNPSNDPVPFFPPTPLASPPENASLILEAGSAPIPPLTPPTANMIGLPANYRIILSPREMAGEQQLILPTNVIVSFETPDPMNPAFTLSRNVPLDSNGFPQILFSPSGAVVGQGTGTGQIILWVRDAGPTKTPITMADLTLGKGTLITIQPRTGFIAAHPVAPGADPYLFTRDGKSSGL